MIILDKDVINQNAEGPFDVRNKISGLENKISNLENRVSDLEKSKTDEVTQNESI